MGVKHKVHSNTSSLSGPSDNWVISYHSCSQSVPKLQSDALAGPALLNGWLWETPIIM